MQEQNRKDNRREQPIKLTILYLNAQSVVNKVQELNCVSEDLKPDIILVTESWCHSDIQDSILGLTMN